MTATDLRTDWLTWRRGGVGGSDIAAIVGLSPWASAYSVWADKVGLSSDDGDSPAMEFGRRAEPMLATWFTDRTGLPIHSEQQRCTGPEPWMLCTVDGFAGQAVVEWKTTSDPEWDEPPTHYRCQAQWNMAVTGATECWFGVLHLAFGRPRFATYLLARDDTDIRFLTARARRFWHHHVLTGIPPDIDGTDATRTALTARWPHSDDSDPVEADEQLAATLQLLHTAKASRAKWDDQVATYENRIRAALGEHERLTRDGRNLATWRWQERRTVDLDTLRTVAADLVEAHTTVTRSRVLRINPPKEKP